MTRINEFLAAGLLLITLILPAPSVRAEGGEERIVSLGGMVTEVIFALGMGDRVVGVDASSYHPAAVNRLPRLAYHRQISAEGVLSLRPTLVLATAESGPALALRQIEAAGVRVGKVGTPGLSEGGGSVEEARRIIREVSALLDREEEGAALVAGLEERLREAEELAGGAETEPRVLFVYARGAGTLMVGGEETGADRMIKLAGGQNPAGFKGFRPLTAESLVAARPDAFLLLDKGLESLGGVEGFLKVPGVAQTPAGRNRAIIAMDDLYLLGFGPRLGDAVVDLTRKLHPELTEEDAEVEAE